MAKANNGLFETRFKALQCRMQRSDDEIGAHFLEEPKLLPCQGSACLECIRRARDVDSGVFKCPLCQEEHIIENLDELKANTSLEELIKTNADVIAKELIDKLDNNASQLKEMFADRDELMDRLVERTKDNISTRVEAIKDHLETLHAELRASLAQIKLKVNEQIKHLNSNIQQKTSECKEFLDKASETSEQDIFKCQEYADELKTLDESFHKILRKVSFEPSDWRPNEAFIGIFDAMLLHAYNKHEEKTKEEDFRNETTDDLF